MLRAMTRREPSQGQGRMRTGPRASSRGIPGGVPGGVPGHPRDTRPSTRFLPPGRSSSRSNDASTCGGCMLESVESGWAR